MVTPVAVVAVGICLSAAPFAQPDAMVLAFEGQKSGRALQLATRALAQPDLTEEARRRALLVKAFAALRQHRPQDAKEAFAALNEAGIDLGNYQRYLIITLDTYRGDCEDAEALASQVGDQSAFSGLVSARMASCYLRSGDFERAYDAAVAVRDEGDSRHRQSGAELLRARVLEERGELRAARDAYRTLVVEFPEVSSARTAAQRLEALRRRGIRNPPLTPAELLTQADAYRELQRPGPAKRLYVEVQKQTVKKRRLRPLWQTAQLGLAEIDVVHRTYGRAAKKIDPIAQRGAPEVQARALYLAGDVAARRGRLTEALDQFDRLIEHAPESPFAARAAISAMKLCHSNSRLEKASAYAEWLITNESGEESDARIVEDDGVHRQMHDRARQRDEARWFLAWNARRTGSAAEVMDGHLAQIDTQGEFGQAALYWRAKLAIDAGKHSVASGYVDQLIRNAPANYYTLMGLDLLQQAGVTPGLELHLPALAAATAPGDGVDLLQPPTGVSADLNAGLALAEAGLISEARSMLRLLPLNRLNQADRIAAAWLYRKSEELHLAAVVSRSPSLAPYDLVQEPVLFQLAFPRPFTDLVETNAERYALPQELLFAIMREESAFNPAAVSPRYARGLMQMIRPTARRMAKDAKLKRFRTRDLHRPEISVKLGSHYVAGLMEMFDNDMIATIASYHAGERAVARWLRTRGDLPPDEFIEEIPYTSTRRYVKKVLRSYGVYRLLYNPQPTSAIGQLRSNPQGHSGLVQTAALVGE